MDPYSGFEPQVGEIRALRTFRIGVGGVLFPLFSGAPWTAEINTCRCRVPQPPAEELLGGASHTAPHPECSCGYYAYGDESGAAEFPQARHVLAVVSCWGKVVAGTRGLRAQHARIDALWMSPRVPLDLSAAVAARYPSTRMYTDRVRMLSEQPPTQLECYEIPSPRQRSARRYAWHTVVLTGLAVGMLPSDWIWRHHDARILWGLELAFFFLAALLLRLLRTDRQSRFCALMFAAVTLWLIAPFGGAVGTVWLRLPIVQILLLERLHRVRLRQEGSRFPAVIRSG